MNHVLDSFNAATSWGPALLTGGAVIIYGITLIFAERLHDTKPRWMDD